jgi:myo-inositol-1(or 4)-monophosphatase
MTTYLDLLPVAQQAIDIAHEYILSHKAGRLTFKTDRDMASDVDYAVERSLREHLRQGVPDIGFLGEEDGGEPGSAGLTWALDPVDGTVNFVHGHPLVCVSLGLLDRGRPVLGVIDAPFLGTRFWAVEGNGAFRDGHPIAVSGTSSLSDAIIAIGDYAVGLDAEVRNAPRLALTSRLAATAQRVRMHGSAAIDLAWFACGSVDAMVMLSNNPWDVAAGIAIAREAGGLVLDAQGADHTADSDATIGVAPSLRDEFLAVVQG